MFQRPDQGVLVSASTHQLSRLIPFWATVSVWVPTVLLLFFRLTRAPPIFFLRGRYRPVPLTTEMWKVGGLTNWSGTHFGFVSKDFAYVSKLADPC